MFNKFKSLMSSLNMSMLGDKKMKTFYKREKVIILDKSCDLVLIEFVKSKKTKWVREDQVYFSN